MDWYWILPTVNEEVTPSLLERITYVHNSLIPFDVKLRANCIFADCFRPITSAEAVVLNQVRVFPNLASTSCHNEMKIMFTALWHTNQQ